MIQEIIAAMMQEIAKYKLEVLQRYPIDMEVDKERLEKFAHPGVSIAWMVGDCHTHMAPLGIHQELNEYPKYLINLANNDRFYLLTIGTGQANFTLKEIARTDFPMLATTPIAYRRLGKDDAFWLYKNDSRVGSCVITREGTYENPLYKVALTPMSGISKLDKVSLLEWGQQAVAGICGSLLHHSHVEWQPSINSATTA